MPVIIPQTLPATKILQDNNIFVMNDSRACAQDIRPLKICILNLMPDKITTENQLLRQLSNSIIQVEITLLAIKSHKSKNTCQDHLNTFYKNFDTIQDQNFDALIITGAPIEHLDFQDITYWTELKKIFDWSKTHVFTSLFICWAAQAALYHFYDIEKEEFPDKLFGVYEHEKTLENEKIFTGLNKHFFTPHSRNTQSNQKAIVECPDLEILARSKKAGIHMLASKDRTQLFFNGHFEYDEKTLLKEYKRDLLKSGFTKLPENYFVCDDPLQGIETKWFSDASLIFMNWLNYYVYQETAFDFTTKHQ